MGKKLLRICPKCKKPTLKPAYNVSGWLAPDMFRCQECGYIGNFYIEIEEEEYVKYQKSLSNGEEDQYSQ
jgi:RNase P subunit RPR2